MAEYRRLRRRPYRPLAGRADQLTHNELVALTTAFTRLLSIKHPIVLAPMAGTAGGSLAAAVSEGGGLGLLGGGFGRPDWLDRELAVVQAGTSKPWGIGFLCWSVDLTVVEQALAHQPRAVMLSFGDPTPFIPAVRQSGALLIIQVTDLDEARQAIEVGADVIVAQGTEAGGHGGTPGRGTFSFVPVVADLAAPVPVLAAGGIADGRGLAAALALGAAGALIGTRFQATVESLADSWVTKALIEAHGDCTERSTILDIARGSKWPSRYSGRALRHPFVAQWRGHEDQLAADHDARRAYEQAVSAGEYPPGPVWASEAIDLISDLRPATDLVGDLAAAAEATLTRLRT
ncbi:MAG: nitronate monooxygenase [Actinobacteria bacterium]|nr:nitronate monooxygenase [Actinomycetota bacterium]